MNRKELCQQKMQQLFQEEQKIDSNDPEFMLQLQRFIFGEVFYVGELTDQTRELITCTVLCVLQTLPQLKVHTQAALNTGVKPAELKEAIYQCAPFIGYPKTLNAIQTINDVFAKRGIALPLDPQCHIEDEQRYSEGLKIQMPIYGNEIKDKYAYLPEDIAVVLPKFLTEWCFGDFYTRQALDIQTRELIIFCILTALNATNQLYSHAIGNIKVGNSLERLYATLVHCLPYLGFPCIFNAFNAIKELAK